MNLSFLASEVPGVTQAFGMVLAEAAAVCLENQRHNSGVVVKVDGNFRSSIGLSWSRSSDREQRCYNDLGMATELGAYGLAILVVQEVCGKRVVERSRKGAGFDYWLGEDDGVLFQKKARLEVSGILSGDESRITSRVGLKVKQVRRQAKGMGSLPAYVAVVEFSAPKTRVVVFT